MKGALASAVLVLLVVIVVLELLPGASSVPAPSAITGSDQPSSDVQSLPQTSDEENSGIPEEPAEVLENNRWVSVQAIGRRNGEVRIQHPRKEGPLTEWVPATSVRFLAEDEDVRSRGWTAEVERAGRWRPCRLLKQNNARYFVHYLGESNSFDEWVDAERIRNRSQ